MDEIPIAVRKIKVVTPLAVEGLPAVPLDGPIGDLTLRLALEGSNLSVPARINGKGPFQELLPRFHRPMSIP